MYIPLYVKTNYSLLSSLFSIDDIISLCLKNNITSIAICDKTMYACMEFYKKCLKNNIKPIIGYEANILDNKVLLYAKDYEGYKSLIKLSTINSERDLTIDDLTKYNNNLIAIVPFNNLIIYKDISSFYKNIYIGCKTSLEEKEASTITKDLVYINELLYLSKKDSEYLKYLEMIRDGKTISDEYTFNKINNFYVSESDLLKVVSKRLIDNTKTISDMCNLTFPKAKLLLPIYKCEDGMDSKTYLAKLSYFGLSKRLVGNILDNYKERLKYELSIIDKMGFSNYFLVVYDFIKYAKKNNILVGPGRGSAAGSLVSYSLGITDIDPLKYDLLFERFLNPERVSMPDIDTDFPDVYREQVIDYVTNKYGLKNVAGIITFGTLGLKQAIRDVSRVLNIPLYKVDELCKCIPMVNKLNIKEFYNSNMKFKSLIDNDKKLEKMLQVVNIIEGFPRHTSIHAAGIVMSEDALDEVIPLVKNDNNYITGYSSNYLEELGLLKMDFLGLKNLTTIMNIIKDIKANENITIDFNNIPLDDKDAISIFTTANTLGIFQFESTGMRNFLYKLKPTSFEDIFAAIALFRPGPAVNIDSYIRRAHGLEKIEYIDDSLKDILYNTYGIIIYQEQIMLIASKMANYSLGEADILRRAMSKKKMDILKAEEEKFIKNSTLNGYSLEVSKKVFDLILNFANYGFNRSHSVAYSIIAYKMAYLKSHYPKYFYSNLLSSEIGSETKTKEYIYEAKQVGINILKPNILLSSDHYEVVEDGIVFPISSIKSVGVVACSDILKARATGFTDIYDCFSKLTARSITKKILEALIDADCFAPFGYNHATIHHNLDNLINYAELTKDLDPSLVIKPEIEVVKEYSKESLMLSEKEVFGFYFSMHPVTNYKKEYNTIPLKKVAEYYNKTIELIGLIDNIKVIDTKKHEKMAFIKISDEDASADITLFPQIFELNKDLAKAEVIKVLGTIEKRFDKIGIIAKKIEKL